MIVHRMEKSESSGLVYREHQLARPHVQTSQSLSIDMLCGVVVQTNYKGAALLKRPTVQARPPTPSSHAPKRCAPSARHPSVRLR